MSEIDVNGKILSALESSYTKDGDAWSVNARPVTKFDTSKVVLRLVQIEYPDLASRLVNNPVLLDQATIENSTKATVTKTFGYSKSVTDSYEWSITAGLKLTASAKFKAGLPLVGEGEVTTAAELSFAAGYKNTHSETIAFTDSVQVQVPAETSVSVKALLAQGSVSGLPFTATLQAYGQVGAYTAFGGGQGGLSNFEWQWSDLDTGIGWTNPNFKSFPALIITLVGLIWSLSNYKNNL